MPNSEKVLSDLTVLDLSQEEAGSYCTKLLAGLGAEVIKVEPTGIGDAARRAGPFLKDEPNPETSAAFLFLNTGKKSITLDVRTEAGAEVLRHLAQRSHVLVESFPPSYMDQLGLGYPRLGSENPRLIYTSVSPFGQTGPYRDYKGSDIIAQAIGSMMYVIGTPDREPLKIGGNVALYTTGVSAFSATMLAIHVQDLQGHGQHVDVSAMETMTLVDIHSAIRFQFRGDDGARRENALLQAKDGWVSPGLDNGITEETWPRLCRLMGRPELANDPVFSTREGRREHQKEMLNIIGQWVATRPKEEVYHAFQALRTVAGYVATVEDLFTSKQLASRQFFQPVDHPFTGSEVMYPTLPFALDGDPRQETRAPLLGEHNDEVYGGRLGLSREDVGRLRDEGVI